MNKAADDRVLLLDMRTAGRGRLAASINKLGYIVTRATDLAMAQAIWQLGAFPIVIADLGTQQAQITELRVRMPGSAIIVIGARTLESALSAWHAGADDYLPRPVRQNELSNALEHVLRNRATEPDRVRLESSGVAEFRRMAGALAHQINTPLTPILGMADLLAEELPPNHPCHKYAQVITAAALRIRDVTWMMADIARQSR
ncbi:MAG: histidine kinase dimerization/phospho-acceptor domain-containing protein [Roseiflexaceae bacterium]